MNNKSYLERIILILNYIIAFAIPLHKKAIPILFILLAIFVLINLLSNFSAAIRDIKSLTTKSQRFYIFLLPILYLLYALSVFYSENISEAFFNLEIKLSLLAFPIIFLLQIRLLTNANITKILLSFVYGTIVSSVICFTNGVFKYIQTNDFYTSFLYKYLSIFHHTSYFSMYVNFAIIILLILFFIKKISGLKVLSFVPFLIIISWLLMSRAGILTLFLTFIAFIIALLVKKQYKLSVIILGFSLIFSLILINLSSHSYKRISSSYYFISSIFQKDTSKDNSSRTVTWSGAWQVIKEHPLTGVGIGDAKDEITESHKKNNFQFAYEKRLDAHNQFLQTWVTVGILGLIIILILFAWGIINSIKNRSFILPSFFLLTGINFLFESMLETQSGVVFFSYFIILLYIETINKVKETKETISLH